MSKFLQDLKIGNIGEQAVFDYLKNQKNTLALVDVRDVQFFREADVDFIQVIDNQLYPRLIEVKTDTMAHITGNIPYEFISNYRINSIGCFEKTKSTHLFYYLTETNKFYILNTKALQEYVKKNKVDLKLIPMGDNARGYLLKLQKLIEEGICWDMGVINT